MKRFKYRVKFKTSEIPIIAEALLLYQENAATDEKLFFKISRMIEHCYINTESAIERNKRMLENQGFEIVKKES